jgi:Methylase involved in ubiquinone/menaquinone biosynthesis
LDALKEINNKTKTAYNLAAAKYHELFCNEMNEKEYDRMLLDRFALHFNKNSLICDAGCGPSGHIGKYLFDKGLKITGLDISDKCAELAKTLNPLTKFICGDICSMPFAHKTFDGIVSYYSIVDTPKQYVNLMFNEFNRVLKPGGYLLTAVKAGIGEGYMDSLCGIKTEIYFTLFTNKEIKEYFVNAGFDIEFAEKRNPYDFEINNERIFTIGRKPAI